MFRFSFFFSLIIAFIGTIMAHDVSINKNMMKGAYYRQKYADSLLSLSKRIDFLDSLIELHPVDKTALLEKKIEMCYENGYYDEVIETFDSISSQSAELAPAQMCRYMFLQALAFSNNGDYRHLAKCVPAIIALPKPDTLCYYDAAAYELISNLSNQLTTSGEYGAIRKVEDMLLYAKAKGMSDYVVRRLEKSLISMRADSAQGAGDLNLTLKLQEELLCLPLNRHERMGVKLNLGMTYLRMGQEDMALDIFVSLLSEPPSHRNHSMALVNSMHILNRQKRYSESLALYERCKATAFYADNSIGMPYLLANRAIALAGINNYREAYDLMSDAMTKTDSLRISLGYREGDLNISLDQAAMTITKLEKNIMALRVSMWVAIVVAILGLGGVAYFVKRWRDVNKRCTNLDREITEARERSVNTTSDFLRLARVNESMEQIDSICRERKIPDNLKLDRILQQLDSVSLVENAWEVFRHNFEGVHSGFFRCLKDRHPDITASEMRMCAYVLMHLSSKEIATLTGRTLRSVESMRYRIQKKIGISGKESLADYLLHITK